MSTKQNEANQRRSFRRMEAIISGNFEHAQLLTLAYSPGVFIPQALDKSQYSAFMHRARRLMGGPFPYVKISEYGSNANITHRLITNLSPELCREIASGWFMGPATVEPLNAIRLAAITASLAPKLENRLEKNRKTWAASRSLTSRSRSLH